MQFKISYFNLLIPLNNRWHPHCKYQNHNHKDKLDAVDCTGIVMADGKSHTSWNYPCVLCGRSDKAKVTCADDGCIYEDSKKRKKQNHYHLSCARQAGLDVSDSDFGGHVHFELRCFRHAKCEYALRARLEDLIEFERARAGLNLENVNSTMSLAHATSLINLSVTIMGVLGWAWRWADWWVLYGDTWEPLIDEGQDESSMSKDELRIVESTPESRCEDARRCRLAAFGAALRNRDYDKDDDDDRFALDRALRAILNTPSLVGPLKKVEVDFFANWLGRAYRYKSILLGFGEDAIPVSDTGSCLHHDGSKKYELGDRPLPGKKRLPNGKIFEVVDEVDDFLKIDVFSESSSISPSSPSPIPAASCKEKEEEPAAGKKRKKQDKAEMPELTKSRRIIPQEDSNTTKKSTRRRQLVETEESPHAGSKKIKSNPVEKLEQSPSTMTKKTKSTSVDKSEQAPSVESKKAKSANTDKSEQLSHTGSKKAKSTSTDKSDQVSPAGSKKAKSNAIEKTEQSLFVESKKAKSSTIEKFKSDPEDEATQNSADKSELKAEKKAKSKTVEKSKAKIEGKSRPNLEDKVKSNFIEKPKSFNGEKPTSIVKDKVISNGVEKFKSSSTEKFKSNPVDKSPKIVEKEVPIVKKKQRRSIKARARQLPMHNRLKQSNLNFTGKPEPSSERRKEKEERWEDLAPEETKPKAEAASMNQCLLNSFRIAKKKRN